MRERQPVEWVAGVLGWTPGSDDQRAAIVAAVDAWEADRARIATLEAQRDALVPLAWWAVQDEAWDYPTDEAVSSARVALAAISAERETTTEEDT